MLVDCVHLFAIAAASDVTWKGVKLAPPVTDPVLVAPPPAGKGKKTPAKKGKKKEEEKEEARECTALLAASHMPPSYELCTVHFYPKHIFALSSASPPAAAESEECSRTTALIMQHSELFLSLASPNNTSGPSQFLPSLGLAAGGGEMEGAAMQSSSSDCLTSSCIPCGVDVPPLVRMLSLRVLSALSQARGGREALLHRIRNGNKPMPPSTFSLQSPRAAASHKRGSSPAVEVKAPSAPTFRVCPLDELQTEAKLLSGVLALITGHALGPALVMEAAAAAGAEPYQDDCSVKGSIAVSAEISMSEVTLAEMNATAAVGGGTEEASTTHGASDPAATSTGGSEALRNAITPNGTSAVHVPLSAAQAEALEELNVAPQHAAALGMRSLPLPPPPPSWLRLEAVRTLRALCCCQDHESSSQPVVTDMLCQTALLLGAGTVLVCLATPPPRMTLAGQPLESWSDVLTEEVCCIVYAGWLCLISC